MKTENNGLSDPYPTETSHIPNSPDGIVTWWRTPRACKSCGVAMPYQSVFEVGRQKQYCSDKCRQRACRARRQVSP